MAELMVCRVCAAVDSPRIHKKGSRGIEQVSWLFPIAMAVTYSASVIFFLPALFYSRWRAKTKVKVCRACGSPDIGGRIASARGEHGAMR